MVCAQLLSAAIKNILLTLTKLPLLKLKTDLLVFGGTNLCFAADLEEIETGRCML